MLLCIHLWSSMLWYLHWSGWCSPENGTKEHEIQGHCGHSKIPGGEAEKEAAVEQVSGRPVARGVAFGFERTCLGCRGTRDTSWRFMSWVMRHSAVQPCKKHQKTTCRRPTSMWLGQNRLFDFVCLALELGIVFFLVEKWEPPAAVSHIRWMSFRTFFWIRGQNNNYSSL